MAEMLKRYIKGLLTPADELDTVIKSMDGLLSIDTTEGIWLDISAKIVGEVPRDDSNRTTLTDDELRDRIRVRIQLNNGFGEIGSVKNAVRRYLLMPVDGTWSDYENEPVTIIRDYPGHLTISIGGGTQNSIKKLDDHIAAGIGVTAIRNNGSNTFRIGTGGINPLTGLGSTSGPGVGGKLSEIIGEL